jgi:hypothetical protein
VTGIGRMTRERAALSWNIDGWDRRDDKGEGGAMEAKRSFPTAGGWPVVLRQVVKDLRFSRGRA